MNKRNPGLRFYPIERMAADWDFFGLIRKLRSLLNKTLRGMRARAKWMAVAKAAALGAKIPLAELFVSMKKRQSFSSPDEKRLV